jgi:biopolymer transport protein ExbD
MATRFRKDEDGKSKRVVRRQFGEAAELSITSLLDALTIILVFLIKNMSMDAQTNEIPKNMAYPSTITNEELIKNGLTLIVRLYPDKVMIGTNHLKVGTLKQLIEDPKTREIIFNYMKSEAAKIAARNARLKSDFKPVLLVQADKQVICQYVTTLIKIGAGASFENIYFSTLKDDAWLTQSAKQGQ